MKRTYALLVLLSVSATTPTGATAQTLMDRGPPQHRVVHRNALALRYNPIGVLYEGRFSYRYRLFESESRILRDNFVSIGAAPGASPAFGRIGVVAEVQPVSVLTLYALYEVIGYFGAFDHLQSFPSPSSEFDDDTLEGGDAYATSGSQLVLGANVQLKVSDVVVRTQLKFLRASFDLRPGDRAFYDPFFDVLAPDDGWFMTNDADVLYQPSWGLVAGVRYTVTRPFYSRATIDGGEIGGRDNAMHRLGPLVGWAIRQRDGDPFNVLVFAAAQWWLVHRYRTGENTSQGLPMLALGIQTTGDLLPLE